MSESTFGTLEDVPSIDEDATASPSSDTAPKAVPTCTVCGIDLEYKGRGRPPTKCPEHKGKIGGGSGNPRTPKATNSKANREAAELAAKLNAAMVKAGILIAPFESYDALTIVTSAKPISRSAENVLASHDNLRKTLSATSGNTDVAGLVFAVVTSLALPLLAHHGIIPATVRGKPVGEMLEKMPQLLMKLERGMDDAAKDIMEQLNNMQRGTAGNAENTAA